MITCQFSKMFAKSLGDGLNAFGRVDWHCVTNNNEHSLNEIEIRCCIHALLFNVRCLLKFLRLHLNQTTHAKGTKILPPLAPFQQSKKSKASYSNSRLETMDQNSWTLLIRVFHVRVCMLACFRSDVRVPVSASSIRVYCSEMNIHFTGLLIHS